MHFDVWSRPSRNATQRGSIHKSQPESDMTDCEAFFSSANFSAIRNTNLVYLVLVLVEAAHERQVQMEWERDKRWPDTTIFVCIYTGRK